MKYVSKNLSWTLSSRHIRWIFTLHICHSPVLMTGDSSGAKNPACWFVSDVLTVHYDQRWWWWICCSLTKSNSWTFIKAGQWSVTFDFFCSCCRRSIESSVLLRVSANALCPSVLPHFFSPSPPSSCLPPLLYCHHLTQHLPKNVRVKVKVMMSLSALTLARLAD